VIFCWLCFPQVVQKQMLVEVKNRSVIYGKLCQEYWYQKLIKSDNWFSSYSQKCWGCFLDIVQGVAKKWTPKVFLCFLSNRLELYSEILQMYLLKASTSKCQVKFDLILKIKGMMEATLFQHQTKVHLIPFQMTSNSFCSHLAHMDKSALARHLASHADLTTLQH